MAGIVIPNVTDVNVTIDIDHPQPTVGLTNPNLFVKGDKEGYGEYTTIEDVMADYPMGTPAYNAAYAVFAQPNAPELVAITSYVKDNSGSFTAAAPTPEDLESTPTADGAEITESESPTTATGDVDWTKLTGVAKAVADYFYRNWEFALMPEYDEEDALDLATLIEKGGYDGKGFHFFFPQVSDFTKENPFKDFHRTWCFYHTDADEYYTAALVGKGGAETVGSISWKFVSDLVDITPESLPITDMQTLDKNGYIAYYTKGAHSNQTTDANPLGDFIDTYHGADWIKSETENQLQNLLNTSGKLTFDKAGVAKIEQVLRTILNQATSQTIIDTDDDTGDGIFNLTVKQRADLRKTDIAKRLYKGAFFDYQPSGAINHINVGITQDALA
ncbi:DUF3383 family protein [Levilactobacillus angrenensis]|uniref:DUF3383 family protein n=1 Tax=Levilactobacillus angrenensis TaxID=2486020 RepID=UPI000F769A65|nr:DUF3383 family protein [Levilactobacillus angrenensis]